MKKIKPYDETHQQGFITIEQEMKRGGFHGDIGIQIAEDGRIWICVDGMALIRFRPLERIKDTFAYSIRERKEREDV